MSIDTPPGDDFFYYWDSLGFFDTIEHILPPRFFLLFQLARTIASDDKTSDAYNAIEEMTRKETGKQPDREEDIRVNHVDRSAPLADHMELEPFRKITELKKALPRELAMEEEIFDIKLLTKSLMVEKFYENPSDRFQYILNRNSDGNRIDSFEQKFYILLDRSRSMEKNMRSFYSKSIVVEFLRKKMNTRAIIYYRPFDSQPGELYKVTQQSEYPELIKRILYTTTGGNTTNLQGAITRAVDDITFDKESLDTEILVVTDGISKIDREALREKLGEIKLNVLKIGDEMALPDFYEMEKVFKKEHVDIDSSFFNLREVKKGLASQEGKDDLSLARRRANRFIYDTSREIFKDVKSLSHKYIEIGDINSLGLFDLHSKAMENINYKAQELLSADFTILDSQGKIRLFKEVYFFIQYLQMLMDNSSDEKKPLEEIRESLLAMRKNILKDPELLYSVMKSAEFDAEKKIMKEAHKDARKLMKEMMSLNNSAAKDLRNAQLRLAMGMGEGSMGKLLKILFQKLFDVIKRILHR